jgi:hypothetical protein
MRYSSIFTPRKVTFGGDHEKDDGDTIVRGTD